MARLVAKGLSQRHGIDYVETFSSVVKYDTLRVILSSVAVNDREMSQLDLKTAFLYGELDEEIYLEQPEGFILSEQEDSVCHLHKCLYGLKQASWV
jgi:ATP-binding cassette subfamily B (MDR/TAP) protein 1